MPTIYDYTDYRAFLQDYYLEHKERNPHFSHRYIAQKLGLKSTGHFAQIVRGRVNISTALIPRFIEFLKFNRKEGDYFENLVLFEQAKNHGEKRRYYEKLLALKGIRPKVLDPRQYEFYSKWYYTAVLEVIALTPFHGDFRKLARAVTPRISTTEARETVALLERMRLIRRDADGTYRKVESTISSGYGAHSVALNNFQIEMMRLAQEAIDRFPREERSLSTVTVGVSACEYKEVIEELRAFRRRVLDIAKGADSAERIYQLNIQVFPLSEPVKTRANP
ncbi:MAG: TIGR02147 family protein [Chitinivibrionales bacterium]|nr:TIGR02147 family protein [Chitinivibrionales bacterium]MBD3355827.1 TIGR02147 family protein [Chitinivibrionales bacterium]